MFWDNELLGTFDERYVLDDLQEYSFAIEDSDPGFHTLAFRLDPYVDINSVVTISNVQVGSLIPIDLPSDFDNDGNDNIFKATFGSSFGSISFGHVAQSGLSKEFVLGDLTVVGSLAGGGDLGTVDLIYVPEPGSWLLLFVALECLCFAASRRCVRQ